jgi:hypothetical protein
MTTPRFRRVAVFVGAAALAAGAGIGVAAQGDAGTRSSATSVSRPADGAGGPGAMDLGGLAERLGVSERRLRSAMEAIRPSGGPPAGGPGTPPDGSDPPARRPPAGGPGDMAAALAGKLGLSTAKVEKALAAGRPAGGPPAGMAPPSGDQDGAPPSGSAPGAPPSGGSASGATAS